MIRVVKKPLQRLTGELRAEATMLKAFGNCTFGDIANTPEHFALGGKATGTACRGPPFAGSTIGATHRNHLRIHLHSPFRGHDGSSSADTPSSPTTPLLQHPTALTPTLSSPPSPASAPRHGGILPEATRGAPGGQAPGLRVERSGPLTRETRPRHSGVARRLPPMPPSCRNDPPLPAPSSILLLPYLPRFAERPLCGVSPMPA